MKKAVKPVKMLEREYDKYHVKIYFAKDDVCEAGFGDSFAKAVSQRAGKPGNVLPIKVTI